MKRQKIVIPSDAVLIKRRKQIVGLAAGARALPQPLVYLPHENFVWKMVSTSLRPIWDKVVADEVLEAREVIKLPIDFVPQLTDVSASLSTTSGFRFRAVPGLVDINEFFGALSRKQFLSTQYLRHPKTPLYTSEPDIIHEVIGHGTLLANNQLARLHELAGEALLRVKTKRAKQFIADVWWFSGEFGVIRNSRGIKAFGAGLLSSVGELGGFQKNARIRPMDILKMGTTPYRIDEFQKELFWAESVDHLLDYIGGFFKTVDDSSVNELLRVAKVQ